MFVVWVLPYGLAGAYDFLLGQGFFPSTYPTLSQVIPSWLPPTWLLIGVIAIIIVTFEGAYRITQRAGKPTSEIQAIAQGFENIADVLERKLQSIQPNVAFDMAQAIGIAETSTGKPELLYADTIDANPLGTIHTGSKQTFSGLPIDDSPVYFHIPNLAYVVIMITPISNDTFEIKFMVDIEKKLHQAATLTVLVDSQAVSFIIPVGARGFREQISKVIMDRSHGAALGQMSLEIKLE